jgi:predicted DNA-binding transcriptional regulator AlpA
VSSLVSSDAIPPDQRENDMVFKMLKEPQVRDATGWSHATLWQKIKDGKFRAPVKIDPDGRAVGWPEPWIEAIQDRVPGRGVARRLAWVISGVGRIGQMTMAGNPTMGSSLKVAMVSRVM